MKKTYMMPETQVVMIHMGNIMLGSEPPLGLNPNETEDAESFQSRQDNSLWDE